MGEIGKILSEHLKGLSTKNPEVTVTSLDKNAISENGTLAALGDDFLEINRKGQTGCTVVPFSAIAKIDFQA